MRITMENQAILRRLQEKKSNYDVVQWEEQRLKNEKLIKLIWEFPVKALHSPHNQSRLTTADNRFGSRDNLTNTRGTTSLMTRQGNRRRNINTQQDFYKKSQDLTGTSKDNPSTAQQPIVGVEDENGTTLLARKSRLMSGWNYIIEVSKTSTTFYISATKKRNQNENFLIELEWEQAREILLQFNIKWDEDDQPKDYDTLIGSLEIMENRLVLLNPNAKPQKVAF